MTDASTLTGLAAGLISGSIKVVDLTAPLGPDLMHKANKYGSASLSNLDQLPPKGAILIAAPLKFLNGTGSPVRALALIG